MKVFSSNFFARPLPTNPASPYISRAVVNVLVVADTQEAAQRVIDASFADTGWTFDGYIEDLPAFEIATEKEFVRDEEPFTRATWARLRRTGKNATFLKIANGENDLGAASNDAHA